MGSYIFPWPACSHNMSPIEEDWKRMKQNITRHNPHPTTISELRQAILEEWDNLTPATIANYTMSVPEQIQDLIIVRCSHTKW
ncbi:hypothetical protein HOY82DRAFT_476486 [Tuber indicum]|nr:hypothetical protein HOY82DRAFT_476486 [Tuber indicum]